MAGHTAMNNPWTGPQAPKIGPTPVIKTWRNDRDPTRRRATFDVSYPLLEISIEKSDDLHTKLPSRFEKTKRRSIRAVRFNLSARNLILSEADFHECNFHRRDDQGESHIQDSTFKNCTFERCILGGTLYRHVSFEDCAFIRCDVGAAEFHECQFTDCTFQECTGESASFLATEIDPTALLKGMPAPLYNYEGAIPEGEAPADQVATEWVEVRRKIAAQLLRSNTDIHNTDHSDKGLFELKKAEVQVRLRVLQKQPLKEGVARLPFRAVHLLLDWMILNLTKGGTSLSRLFLTAMVFVFLYAFFLSRSHVVFMDRDCHLASFTLPLVLQQLARATSLFLAIGYTAFSGGTLATILLTSASSFGLLWYALVAAVVIHRVYR
jgi:uncharacterized protein YjbI with pentapeptide repeats